MAEFKAISEAEFAKKARRVAPSFRAESAMYEARSGKILVHLTNGVSAAFPVTKIQGLENAPAEALKKIVVQGRGFGLHIPLIDADISVARLFDDFLGSTVMVKAESRASASQKNGLKGGRPKTEAQRSA